MPHDMLLIGVITVPFFGSFAAALLPTNARNAEAWLAGTVALIGLVLVSAAYPVVADGRVIQVQGSNGCPSSASSSTCGWMASHGCSAALITGIGFLVVLYARYYMSPADPVPRFFSFLLAFMGAMLGIVLSGNLIQLVFFWELTSLFSFLLIGYRHQTAQARDGARMALIITSAGGLCLFAGILLLGHIVGSYDLDRVLASGAADPLALTLRPYARPHSSRRPDEERAVPVSFLAAAGDGSADASLGLPPFSHHGESRRVPSGAALAGAGRNQ